MKFFFPDSQDFVDPTFDFMTERRRADRNRSRDDRYAHEVLKRPPFDGLLVSKAIVDGVDASGKSAKYSLAQRHRLLRNGVRDYFRLDNHEGSRSLLTMGDCGAFSYVREKKPPFTVDEVIDFYEQCGFDLGVSVDHVILHFDETLDETFPGMDVVARECMQRQEITLDLAQEFKRRHEARKSRFEPVGVAQGWSPKSYAAAVGKLQRMGYKRIALGGMVPLKTLDILSVLDRVARVRKPGVQLHLLGVTRTEQVEAFDRYGVTSFDTTSPFLRAFKDAKQNYYTANGAYTALRIPQVQGNARVEKLIRSGAIDQLNARRLEQACLMRLRAYDAGKETLERVLDPLLEYEKLVSVTSVRSDRRDAYVRTLSERPWAKCPCEVCRTIGVDVIIFRGSERNKRRGFHNLYVLYERLHHELANMARSSKRRLSLGVVAAGAATWEPEAN
ncbi:MAG TPA: tRNA-guanine transglycosylase DpdA [Gemmatimonadaceae bacterium]|nr:tRNA-guanine transglycosylase DpdA [Gemmatimonadaceae bacterium]